MLLKLRILDSLVFLKPSMYPQIYLNENDSFFIYAKTVSHEHNGQFCLPVYCGHSRLQTGHIEEVCI